MGLSPCTPEDCEKNAPVRRNVPGIHETSVGRGLFRARLGLFRVTYMREVTPL